MVGFCSAGSGVAGMLIPPLFVSVAERFGIRTTFLLETGFCLFVTIFLFLTVRESPQELGLEPYVTVEEQTEKKSPKVFCGSSPLVAKRLGLAASILIGICSCCSYQHLVVLYKTSGFAPVTASLFFTLASLTQVLGKILLGNAADRFGAPWTNRIFFSCMTIGLALCTLADFRILPVAILSSLVLGLGLPLCTVGLSVYAHDMAANSREYSRLVSWFNLGYLLGNMLYAPCMGAIADRTSTYSYAYVLLCVLSVAAFSLIQLAYRKLDRG